MFFFLFSLRDFDFETIRKLVLVLHVYVFSVQSGPVPQYFLFAFWHLFNTVQYSLKDTTPSFFANCFLHQVAGSRKTTNQYIVFKFIYVLIIFMNVYIFQYTWISRKKNFYFVCCLTPFCRRISIQV